MKCLLLLLLRNTLKMIMCSDNEVWNEDIFKKAKTNISLKETSHWKVRSTMEDFLPSLFLLLSPNMSSFGEIGISLFVTSAIFRFFSTTHTLYFTNSLSLFHTHSLSPSLSHTRANILSLSLLHTHTHSLSLSLSLSLSFSLSYTHTNI